MSSYSKIPDSGIHQKIVSLSQIYNYPHSDYAQDVSRDEQFLRCVCLGPWKQQRRINVTKIALAAFEERGRDLRNFEDFEGFPFKWQNQMLCTLAKYLKTPIPNSPKGRTFTNLCRQIQNTMITEGKPKDAARLLFKAVQGDPNKGSKVLWLFLRDYIRIPAFPIDRHIRRFLVEHGLPKDSWKMLDLCIQAGVDPSLFNRGIIFSKNGEPGA